MDFLKSAFCKSLLSECDVELPTTTELQYVCEYFGNYIDDFELNNIDIDKLFVNFPRIYDYISNYPDIQYNDIAELSYIKPLIECKEKNPNVYEIVIKIFKIADFIYHQYYVELIDAYSRFGGLDYLVKMYFCVAQQNLNIHPQFSVEELLNRINNVHVRDEDETKRIDDV